MRRGVSIRVVVAAMLVAVGAVPNLAGGASGALAVHVVSNRADLVSGGDALVRVDLPRGTRPGAVRVLVNGTDRTKAFAVRRNGRYEGLVTGLRRGANSVVAALPGGTAARLTVTNHALAGPIFSGPQIQPWYCLPEALDAQCNRPVSYAYQYMSSLTGEFGAYDPAAPPSDVASTTTDQGKTVPYVVRVETGNMNRNQYKIAVLHDGRERFTRWTGPSAWNHKVYATHGAGCSTSHTEGPAPDVLQDVALSQGFAVMSAAMADNTYSCNVVVQAESMMMAKEHLIEAYGDVRYMFGTGCSGGSIAQLHMANAYPGLYDGIHVWCTMPDVPILDLLDCPPLLRYWETPTAWAPGVVWTELQESAVAGTSTSVCQTWTKAYHYPELFQPRTGVGCRVPEVDKPRVYDPVTNPRGLRCSLQDYLSNVLGFRDAASWGPVEKQIKRGFAGRPYDNVGLQYGLRALIGGQITPAQFVDLNAKVGSLDIDYNFQPQRVAADPAALRTAYRSGFVNEGNNLDKVAIIDTPGYFPGDRYEIHDSYKSWALRARLDAANGHHENQVLWYGLEGRFSDVFGALDEWLTAVEQDTRNLPIERKLVLDRPEATKDTCYYPDQGALCDFLFGPAASIRWGAGGSIATDVVKCTLKPLRRADYYPIQFTDDEWASLRSAFPTGVCDWSRRGVGQQGAVGWQTYQHGPGGRPLGPPPQSVLVRK